MKKFFRGRFELRIDAKGRISLPVGFRELGGGKWVITNSRFRKNSCLHLFPLKAWQEFEQRFAKFPSLNESVQSFQRFYIAGAQEVECDSQGRLIVPPVLRRFAQLESDLVCLGLGDKLEIWSNALWTPIFAQLNDDFESAQAQVAALEEKNREGNS